MRFKGCRHATTLDLRYMEAGDIMPAVDGEEALLLQKQGDAHELAFLERLRQSGRSVVEIPKSGIPLERSVDLTIEAMKEGPEVIFQGALLGGAWGGYTDFLERVEVPSSLGAWSYEVVDTKLKRRPDPKHVLQLSLYSDLLTDVQQVRPEQAHLQLGDGSRFSIRLADVASYARHSRSVFETFLLQRPATRSDPVSGCTLCKWKDHCREEWERDDSLSLVAGITRSQRGKMEAHGITTLSALANVETRIPRLAPDV